MFNSMVSQRSVSSDRSRQRGRGRRRGPGPRFQGDPAAQPASHEGRSPVRGPSKRSRSSLTSLLILTVPTVVLALSAWSPARAETAEVVYESIGTAPGARYSRPLGIFHDASRDECYVADTGNHQIVVCDGNGMPVHRFYHHVTKDGDLVLGEPKSVVVDGSGRIFVADALASYLDVLDPLGRRITTIDPPTDGCGAAERFEFLALGPRGVYATLSCSKRRVAVIAGLEVVETVALAWTMDEPPCITGIAVDESERIFVTDPCATVMVQVYEADGRFVRGFGKHDSGWENFSYPSGIALMRDGTMWIADTVRQVASMFTPEGKFVAFVGGKGSGPGAFEYPSGLATDGESRLFVVERGGERYQCFGVGEVTGEGVSDGE